ncbi:uncharacterized protein LOC113520801 isoform X2 [Galleria mellonella]|uniref:Uncharacterized protein LOC113520801 isoform X2 n=1 Tax=Galleria mellonella TaxID=7137 RepID=A0ABM3MPL0_GALME|nr:uncharacterized protein LOC113520801 isoform X2 [Galleria mellonella]
MLPFLISKTKLLSVSKEKKPKDKSFIVSGDNLASLKSGRKKRRPLRLPPLELPSPCDCSLMHVTRIVINYAPKSRKRGASNIALSTTAWGTTGQRKRMRLPSIRLPKPVKKEKPLSYNCDDFFRKLENQLKALNLGKAIKNKNKGDTPASQRSKGEKESNDGSEQGLANMEEGGESRRRGKRRRKGRQGASDRLTSAGLAAQAQQDPETQIAGIGSDSQNPSSRGSIAPSADDEIITLPMIKTGAARKTDSFLDDEILKYLHREVDEEAIETEFDTKRRYVLEEALRTRPERQFGQEMQTLLREMKVPAMSLGDWLHIPRKFSRQNAQFSLPIDSYALESLTPMNYAARFVTLKKSKQLLYLTVLRKFRLRGYRMPIKYIEEGLILMMGGILTAEQAGHFKRIMDWENYEEEENIPDEIKLTLLDTGFRRTTVSEGEDTEESDENTIKYRTWCGLCAVCERMYGRFPPRDKDPPDGMELSDFSMVETKLATLKVNRGLIEILNAIRER